VRVTVAEIEYEGKLVLDQLLHPASRSEKLRLRIGRASFDSDEIEACTVIEAISKPQPGS
jgi:hypothetical protein